MSELNFELDRLGIINSERLEIYYPRVRDREDIAVLRDPLTEVIVLSRSDHATETYYRDKKESVNHDVHSSKVASPRTVDNRRRRAQFGHYIKGRRWLDFGCGLGGMLDELASDAFWAAGLEANEERALVVTSKGHQVFTSLNKVPDDSVDIITMFHVLEHLNNPIFILKSLSRILRTGGLLLVEVPHSRDALISLYDCDAFKRFTFWSEHLVLHTRRSLELILEEAGYFKSEIFGYQRYSLANHLHWLATGLPGGHEAWSFGFHAVNVEYSSTLVKIDRSDTLIAVVEKP